MKRFLVLPSLLLLMLCATTLTVSADTLKLTGAGNIIWNGVYAGPYTGTLNGNPLTMICVSFDREVSINQTWGVNINQLTASGVANALYGGQTNALLKYQQAAFLYDQMSANPNQAGDIHGAIWNIFNPGLTPDTAGSNTWLSLAQSQNFVGYDFSRFRILTPLDITANGPQEFMTTVPEPTTMLLFGSGLVGLYYRRRRQQSQT